MYKLVGNFKTFGELGFEILNKIDDVEKVGERFRQKIGGEIRFA